MLAYPKFETARPVLPVRVIGLGNAGVHLADLVAMNAGRGVEVVAANTDAQSLAASVAPRKASLGARASRGLGAGGDPEVGADAAAESIEEIRFAVEGAPLVIVLAGLGGGTGSGAAPLVAEAAREAGACVIALVTMPFAFEGRRRVAQAEAAATSLRQHAHAVVRFDNDRMADLASPKAGIAETFSASDEVLSGFVLAFVDLLAGKGPLPVHFGSLMSMLGGGSPSAVFGRGEATGDNRAYEALEAALRSPLLDRGRMLEECHAILAGISGPPSLSFAETAAIMGELSKHVPEQAQLFFGVSVRPEPAAPLSVTLFGNCGEPEQPRKAERPKAPARTRPEPRPRPPAPPPEPVEEPAGPEPPGRLIADEEPPAPQRPVVSKPPAAPRAKQETLQFEPVARGRFEKSEPTIVEGEDLDVPTFLRVGRRR